MGVRNVSIALIVDNVERVFVGGKEMVRVTMHPSNLEGLTTVTTMPLIQFLMLGVREGDTMSFGGRMH